MAIITGMVFLASKSTTNVDAKETIVEKLNSNNSGDVYDYTDPETGVHYLIYRDLKKAGMSVRYNKDGSIMTE